MTIRARAYGARSRCRPILLTEFTDLKTEKTAAFALIRLRKAAVILFFGILFKYSRLFLYAKIRLVHSRTGVAASALLILLYFGLRQSELASITIENETLTCITSKQLKGRVEVKRHIPFTPMAKKVLTYIDFEKAKETKQRTIAAALKRLFPNHHPHELRYTFITRCKECGVNPEVVMLWDGHSFDKDVKTTEVDRGYTDYSEEYLRKEALKVDYEI